jgi:hypothetical protein
MSSHVDVLGGAKVKLERPKKTYNTRDSLVVTDPTTSLALTGLSMRERMGSRVLQWVWSYVTVLYGCFGRYVASSGGLEALILRNLPPNEKRDFDSHYKFTLNGKNTVHLGHLVTNGGNFELEVRRWVRHLVNK